MEFGPCLLLDFRWPEARQRVANANELTWSGGGVDIASAGKAGLLTEPWPIGLAWRPTTGAHVTVQVCSDQQFSTDSLVVFVRHSTDKVHWSEWEKLPAVERNWYGRAATTPTYSKEVRSNFSPEWDKLRIAWFGVNNCDDDTDELVRWVHQNHPEALERNIPYMGWLQFRLVSVGSPATPTIKAMSFQARWIQGGIHQGCKGTEISARSRWYFDAANPENGPVRYAPPERGILRKPTDPPQVFTVLVLEQICADEGPASLAEWQDQ